MLTDPVHEICGAHGGHESAEVRDVRRTGGGRGLRWGQETYWMVFAGRPPSFRYQHRLVDDSRPRTRENDAGRRNKERKVSWRNIAFSEYYVAL